MGLLSQWTYTCARGARTSPTDNKVKTLIFKWKNLTEELFNELSIAKENLSVKPENRERLSNGTFVPVDKTWSDYCEDISTSKQVVNRWLRNWEELKKRVESPPLPKSLFTVIYADPPWEYDFSETQIKWNYQESVLGRLIEAAPYTCARGARVKL